MDSCFDASTGCPALNGNKIRYHQP